ncbi:hypothetical protein L916_01303 [Phytophthora nicotianae]|uniref:Uncharacterized protein n=1 Tax=Phytophthora nicotianae TaxID=4792 RepID=W2JU55_PHYNI|nr:hypothetical protein L916_01303 [Phytophthora nicotianae]
MCQVKTYTSVPPMTERCQTTGRKRSKTAVIRMEELIVAVLSEVVGVAVIN